MSSSILLKLTTTLQNIERAFFLTVFGHNVPRPSVDIYIPSANSIQQNVFTEKQPFSIKDLIGDGFLYAVPKHRRPVEKRWMRKFGFPDQCYKIILPKTNIQVCTVCGHHHELGVLCPHCYHKINLETTEMKEKIQQELGLDPVDKEVVVLYEGEQLEQPEEFWKDKRLVEMPKPRPHWFSKNLLQKTTQQPATSTDVKPTELA